MPGKPKPRPVLTRDRILDAALPLVDRRGLDYLTMRSLGEALSVEAMSLYRYFPSKSDLLEGIADRVLAEIVFVEQNRSWREDLGNAVRGLWRVLVAHPNTVPLFLATPTSIPGAQAGVEVMLRLLGRAGFGPGPALRIWRNLLAFVLGTALMLRTSRSPAPGRTRPAKPDVARDTPLRTAALKDSGVIDHEADFESGLELLLGAIAANRAKPRSPRRPLTESE